MFLKLCSCVIAGSCLALPNESDLYLQTRRRGGASPAVGLQTQPVCSLQVLLWTRNASPRGGGHAASTTFQNPPPKHAGGASQRPERAVSAFYLPVLWHGKDKGLLVTGGSSEIGGLLPRVARQGPPPQIHGNAPAQSLCRSRLCLRPLDSRAQSLTSQDGDDDDDSWNQQLLC